MIQNLLAPFGDQVFAWEWIAVGLVLCAAETLVPGVFLLWTGLAAMATGGVLLVVPLSLPYALLVFALAALIFTLIGRQVYVTMARRAPALTLNQPGATLIGATFMLEGPIVNGEGRIRVRDSLWQVRGPDTPAGRKVTVVAVENAVILRVEPTAPVST